MKIVHKLLFALGLGCFVLLLWRLGTDDLLRYFTTLGWGLVPIILAEGAAEFCHAISWRYCLGPAHRKIPLHRLFQICLAGYAISFLTPTASLAGEVTKGALLAKTEKGPQVVTALLVGKISFALAHLSFVVIGFATVLWHIELPSIVRTSLLTGSVILTSGIVAFLLLQKYGRLGKLVHWCSHRAPRLLALKKLSHSIGEIDEALKQFYLEKPWALVQSVWWHLIGYSFGIFSTWYFVRLVIGPPSAEVAAGIWFLACWFDLVTFAVPLNLGTLEGSRVLIFQTFHLDPAAGLTCGIAARATQLFWVVYGLAGYALLIRRSASSKAALPAGENPSQDRLESSRLF